MRKMRSILLSSTAAFILAMQGALAETPVGADAQTAIAVTIYNNNLALVTDSRTVPLKAGENDVAIIEVSAGIKPESALLTSPGAELSIVEQNFDFDLLSAHKLLEKSVGEKIRIIRTHPETGEDREEEATVLSVAEGVVLQIGDRIEVTPPGRLVYSTVPANLRARPTLVVKLVSDKTGNVPIDLRYLTQGLSWAADYVANLSDDEKTIDLNGWVTLTNQSGITYENAKLQLVAGEVNQVAPMMQRQLMMADAAAAPIMEEKMRSEAAFEYHLYSLERPTTIKQNQTKQVALLSAKAVPVEKQYLFANVAQVAGSYGQPIGDMPRVNADVNVKIANDEASHLGMPLPAGIMRVYKPDSDGDSIFVGEDAIEHTPKNEEVELTLGKAFDITARAKQTGYDRISDRVYENAYEIEIKNAKKEPVTVVVREFLPGEWRILSESHAHEKIDSNNAEWRVAVPAEGSANLVYQVRLAF